jgi:hypothetical protein
MKSLSKHLLVALLCLTTAASYSQTINKPKLFASQADRLEIPESIFSNALNYAAGQDVSILLAPGFTISGTVVSNEQKYSNLKTVVIRSANFDNSLFQISKVANPDNSFYYSGRIINERSADGFEIRKEASGYTFQKIETAKILQDCSY